LIFFRFASAISGGSFDNCPSTTSAIILSAFSKLVFLVLAIGCRPALQSYQQGALKTRLQQGFFPFKVNPRINP
jgi:hypothetical protein